jgi:hypothetical protein
LSGVNHDVMGDCEKPAAKRARVVVGQRGQRFHENLTGRVGGLVRIAEPVIGIAVDWIEITLVQRREGSGVGLGAFDRQRLVVVNRV